MTEQIQKRLVDLKFSLEQLRATLVNEQDASEEEYAAWEEEAEEDRGDEPDVIDNSEAIDRHNDAIEHIDNAIEALNEPE